jgi:magnesium transporter
VSVLTVHRYRGGVAADGAGPDDLSGTLADGDLLWVDGVDVTADELAAIGRRFELHPLTLEDAAHRRQRPRVELFESYTFVATRALSLEDDELVEKELHVLAGPGFIVTLTDDDGCEPVAAARTRCEQQPEMLEREGAGFALYAIVDEVVDGYLDVVERLEDAADELEDAVFDGPRHLEPEVFQERTFRVKRSVVKLRRTAGPLRGGVDQLLDASGLTGPALSPYLRDLEDHLLRVAEMADAIRDLLTSLLEVRVGQVANDLNEVMKKLSAWAGIILVPTLIAGIYGMNFEHMPELSWSVGYPAALGSMALAAWLLYRGFKKQGWL